MGAFAKGFHDLSARINSRFYTSILDFTKDFGAVIANALRSSLDEDEANSQGRANGHSSTKNKLHPAKSVKASAKRIIKAAQGPLEDAVRKESQLSRIPPDPEILKLNAELENSLKLEPGHSSGLNLKISMENAGLTNGDTTDKEPESAQEDWIDPTISQVSVQPKTGSRGGGRSRKIDGSNEDTQMINGTTSILSTSNRSNGQTRTNSSVALSHEDEWRSAAGVPWYMQSFHPDGTTIEEEQWTGRDLVRSMSEDLSDMDEEEMSGLVDHAEGGKQKANGDLDHEAPAKATAAATKKKRAAVTKRKKGWSRR